MRFIKALRVGLLIVVSSSLANAAGEVDTSFDASLVKLDSGQVFRTLVQPDGKIIIAGEFKSVGGVPRTNIARLNVDGTTDTTFNPPAIVSTGQEPAISAIGLQSDGKILVGGQIPQGLVRLNPDGSYDTAFNSNANLAPFTRVYDLKVYPDDRIIFAGFRFDLLVNTITILNPNGSANAETHNMAYRLALQDDGKVIIYNRNADTFSRLNQNLTPDSSFASVDLLASNNERYIHSIVVQPDGKIVVGGAFTVINGSALNRIARFNPNGTVDTTFNIGVSGPNAEVQSVAYMPGGKILIGGAFTSVNGTEKFHVALLNSNGSLDPSFSLANGFKNVYDLDLLPDGKIIASGTTSGGMIHQTNIVKVDNTGARDTQFEGIVGVAGIVYKAVVLPDNKVLVCGDFNLANGAVRLAMARFNADGTLDTGFSQTYFRYNIFNFDVLPNGQIIVSGITQIGEPSTTKLHADGSRASFAPTSYAEDIKVTPDGKVLVGSHELRRLDGTGNVDGSFTITQTNGTIHKIALQPDGKILIGGSFTTVSGVDRGRIARLNANGTLDASFNPLGGANGAVSDIDVQADGKVVIAGAFSFVNFAARRVARLDTDGSIDPGFAPVLDSTVVTVKLQPDGKLLIGGAFTTVDGAPRSRYARLNTNGTLDASFFVGNGANSTVREIDQQSDGKIIMVGEFSSVNGFPAPSIVRLLNAPSVARVAYDYDGDGKADISVFRPAENKWYVLRSSDSAVTQEIFAIAGDIPVPADYDGDGKTDLAIFRPSSGDWWALSSITGTHLFAHWGGAGDIPRPSDFDGDGRADYVVFRPSNNFWYRVSSSNGTQSNGEFGLVGDRPLVGDFDGDGKSDRAIFRSSTGDWWYQSSLDNVHRVVHWGASTDTPVPADFDGDGKTDLAVYRPSIGTWYILNSSNQSFTAHNFGLAEDKPVAGDYDGDGKADVAVFRPSTGIWYLMRSTSGFAATQFGISTDVPTENAFLP